MPAERRPDRGLRPPLRLPAEPVAVLPRRLLRRQHQHRRVPIRGRRHPHRGGHRGGRGQHHPLHRRAAGAGRDRHRHRPGVLRAPRRAAGRHPAAATPARAGRPPPPRARAPRPSAPPPPRPRPGPPPPPPRRRRPPAATPPPVTAAPTPAGPPRASDGQHLGLQPPAVQAAFATTHGASAAQRWADEHEAELARAGPLTPPAGAAAHTEPAPPAEEESRHAPTPHPHRGASGPRPPAAGPRPAPRPGGGLRRFRRSSLPAFRGHGPPATQTGRGRSDTNRARWAARGPGPRPERQRTAARRGAGSCAPPAPALPARRPCWPSGRSSRDRSGRSPPPAPHRVGRYDGAGPPREGPGHPVVCATGRGTRATTVRTGGTADGSAPGPGRDLRGFRAGGTR